MEQSSCQSTEGEEVAESASDDPTKQEGDNEAARRSKCEVSHASSHDVTVMLNDSSFILQTFYEDGLRSLAELTSASIELFRKMAEVSLLPDVRNDRENKYCVTLSQSIFHHSGCDEKQFS